MKQKALTLEEINQLSEWLAQIEDPCVPMEADMLDGFLTAICLMRRPPEIDDWIRYVIDFVHEKAPLSPADGISRNLRSLILKRGTELEQCILDQKPIDPILFEEEDENEGIFPLTPFADGFSLACTIWPELIQNSNKAVQGALVGILRYASNDAQDKEFQDLMHRLDEDVRFANLDESLADLCACVQEIAQVTRS